MLELTIRANRAHRFPSLGRTLTVEVSGTSKVSDIPISLLLQQILKNAPTGPAFSPAFSIAKEHLSGQPLPLTNLRGRPRETFPGGAWAAETGPKDEELYYAAGLLAEPIEEEASAAEDTEQENQTFLPFSVAAKTRFLSFGPQGTILHSVQLIEDHLPRSLLPQATLADLAGLPEASLSEIRFGCEIFQSRPFWSMIGLVPDISARCYFTATTKELSLLLQESVSKKFNGVPLEESGIVSTFDRAFSDCALFSGLSERLRSACQNR